MPAAGRVERIDAPEFDADNRRLKFIEAAVVAQQVMVVSLLAAVVAQHPDAVDRLFVPGDNHAAIPVAGEVFAREKAEAAAFPHGADLFSVIGGAEGLRAVFDDFQTISSGQFENGFHVGRMAEKMNRDDGPGSFCYFPLYFPGIQIERVRFNVDENGDRTNEGDNLGSGNKREGGGDYLVPRTDPAGPQGKQQGIGPAGHSRGEGNAVIGGHFALQGGYFRPEDELALIQNVLQGMVHFAFQILILPLQVDHGDHDNFS